MPRCGSPPGTGGVARSAGVVAKSKSPLTTATTRLLLMSDTASRSRCPPIPGGQLEVPNFKITALFRLFDRKIQPASPFSPRSKVVAHARVADQAQRQKRVCRAVAALTIGNNFMIRRNTAIGVHLLQLIGILEEAFVIQVLCPFQVNGSGNCSAAGGT